MSATWSEATSPKGGPHVARSQLTAWGPLVEVTVRIRVNDIIGMRFGRLVIDHRSPNSGGHIKLSCICDCGTRKVISKQSIIDGRVRSCGCLNIELLRNRRTHGASVGGKKSPEYRAWRGIKTRCLNSNNKDYPNYGGRGIAICDEWLAGFANFHRDMGDRPSPLHSIDRIDSNGNYCPSNCRWATATTQARNTRRVVIDEGIATTIRHRRAIGDKRSDIIASLGITLAIYKQVAAGKTWRQGHGA